MLNYKLLIISRTLPHLGGRERIVQSIIDYFKNYSTVTLVTPDEIEITPGINVVHYKDGEGSWKNILSQLELYDFNVIHCHTFYLADFAIKAANHYKIPLVFSLHGVFLDYYGDKYNDIIKRIADNSTVFTTVSHQYKEMLFKFLNNSVNIEYVSNGIIYRPYNEKYNKKHDSNKIIVAVPARLAKIKGLEYVVDALPLLKQNFEIHICSPAGRKVKEEIVYKDYLLKKIKTNNIYFHEFDNNKWISFLNKTDIVLLPSLIEGQSLSLLEAMSRKKLVIATNVGGNQEIISDGVNGFIIEPKSIQAIAKSLAYVSRLNDDFCKKIKDNAQKTVIENFSFQKMIKNYMSLYEKAILKKQKICQDVQAVIINNLHDPDFLVLKRLNKNTNIYEFRLVKGGIDELEHAKDAITREIVEETGIDKIKILKKLEPYSYSYFLKRIYVTHNVTTYLVQTTSKESYDSIDQTKEGGFNIDSILWVNKKNVDILTYPQEKNLVKQAIQYLEK